MSFFVILALLFCFDVQGSYPVFGELDLAEDPDLAQNPWLVNLTVDSVWNSSDSCSLTVTCSKEDFEISSTFICDTKTCYQEGGEQSETSEWFNGSVYLPDSSFICDHNNQAYWTNDTREIRYFCLQNAGSKSLSDGVSICVVKTVVFSVGLIIMVSVSTS